MGNRIISIFKHKRKIKKMRNYYDNWDTVDYGYVRITTDGRLLSTNNIHNDTLTLDKMQFLYLIKFMNS